MTTLIDAAATRLEKHDLEEPVRAAVLQQLRFCVALESKKKAEKSIAVGASKFGGCPDLPAELEWPRSEDGDGERPLAFLAQIATDCGLRGLASAPAPVWPANLATPPRKDAGTALCAFGPPFATTASGGPT